MAMTEKKIIFTHFDNILIYIYIYSYVYINLTNVHIYVYALFTQQIVPSDSIVEVEEILRCRTV